MLKTEIAFHAIAHCINPAPSTAGPRMEAVLSVGLQRAHLSNHVLDEGVEVIEVFFCLLHILHQATM